MSTEVFLERTLSSVLQRASRAFPALVVTGPRQSGKTTLVRRLFGSSHAYCSLDDPAVRTQARDDPGLVLKRFPPPVILDEIQYAPEMLHHVKKDIDERRAEKGRYVITGSQLFPLMQGVTVVGGARRCNFASLTVLKGNLRAPRRRSSVEEGRIQPDAMQLPLQSSSACSAERPARDWLSACAGSAFPSRGKSTPCRSDRFSLHGAAQ